MDQEKKRLDLSVAQVSGSAIAAVVAAKLASTLGVYGTILGAGVISVIATCGGSLFQHLFKRTGEQIRVATVQADRGHLPATVVTPEPPDETGAHPRGGFREEFGEATTHGTRVRGWKRSAIAAALVFLVSMGGITAYELISDQDFGGTQGRTTFGSVVRGGQDSVPSGPSTDAPSTSRPGTGQERDHRRSQDPSPDPGKGQGRGESGGGGASPNAGASTPGPDPTPSPSTGGDPAPTPAPSTDTPAPDPTGSPSPGSPPAG
ncbi:hypothetical protein [Streptomyces sp. NPDC053755]|uniref:hypothetical protein n=1 Tax=Streptomyces sp. NPDC053755 TaxID=3155815 RepID=UPI003419B30D